MVRENRPAVRSRNRESPREQGRRAAANGKALPVVAGGQGRHQVGHIFEQTLLDYIKNSHPLMRKTLALPSGVGRGEARGGRLLVLLGVVRAMGVGSRDKRRLLGRKLYQDLGLRAEFLLHPIGWSAGQKVRRL